MVKSNDGFAPQAGDALLREMYQSLDRRLRPEDVANLVLRVLGGTVDKATRGVVNRAARGAHRRGGWGYSSMSTDFARPAGFGSQLATAYSLFPAVERVAPAEGDEEVVRVREYAGRAGATIGKEVGRNDFLRHRLSAGGFTLVGKSRLASRLAWEDFAADAPSACFVAYFASRLSLRSEFTNGPRERPYDEVAHALFCHATAGPPPNWWAIAHVFCPGKVLRLMAADVAYWHRATGGGLAPDTAVWAALPMPWDVIAGMAECRMGFVEEVCRAHGVDPVKSGWIAPKPEAVARPFRATPELVHGVTVTHPGLAAQFRKLGVFSGKVLKTPVS